MGVVPAGKEQRELLVNAAGGGNASPNVSAEKTGGTKAAFTPGYMLPLVAVNVFLVSATKLLLPVCRPSVAGYKGIQVDRDINENSNYVAVIQSACIPDEQLVSGDIRRHMYPDTSFSSGIHVSGRRVLVGVNAAKVCVRTSLIGRRRTDYYALLG